MHFMNFRVRRDWQELELQKITAYQKLWLILQGLVIISSLLIFVLNEQSLSSPWKESLRTILSSVIYLLIPAWVIHKANGEGNRKFFFTVLIFIGLGCLGWLTYPGVFRSNPAQFLSFPVLLVLLVPLISGIWLVYLLNGGQKKSKALGLRTDNWLLDILLGTAAGIMLGVHLLLTTILLPGSKFPVMPDGPTLLWLLSFQLGLTALGEELLFRGWGFNLLFEGLKNPLWMVVIQLAVFNILIYLVQMIVSPTIITGLFIVLYRLLLSIVNTILRYHQGSLIPGLVSSTILGIFLWMIVV